MTGLGHVPSFSALWNTVGSLPKTRPSAPGVGNAAVCRPTRRGCCRSGLCQQETFSCRVCQSRLNQHHKRQSYHFVERQSWPWAGDGAVNMREERHCSCGTDIPIHTTAAYRRVLWLVAGLNLALGVAEAVSGYVAGSQALKADALDSLGDGVITGLGLIALDWGGGARTRAALAQGVFLALMGLGVFAATLYRVLVTQVPEAMLMGSFGLIALAVNVISAVILLRYREGDANVRAVWLFSRNDAIGNAAVVAAALAVAATGSPWPDLVTAAAIAGLFIHSAVKIVGDALGELKTIR